MRERLLDWRVAIMGFTFQPARGRITVVSWWTILLLPLLAMLQNELLEKQSKSKGAPDHIQLGEPTGVIVDDQIERRAGLYLWIGGHVEFGPLYTS